MKSQTGTSSTGDQDSSHYIFWILIGAILLLGFGVFSHLAKPIGDEGVHSYQISWFLQGKYEIFKYVTMIPSYHALNAALVNLVAGDDFSYLDKINYLRFANMLLACAAIPAFFALAKYFYPRQAQSRTLQFIFIPFLFPLFFLIYTDLVSLALVLAMIERTLSRKYLWAGLFAGGALLVRQPNLIWVGYCCLIVLLKEDHLSVSRELILSYLKKIWPLLLVILAFGGFVVWNGGVAVGDADQHPVSYNPSNFYFFLLVGFALFLPYNVARIRDIKTLLASHKWIIALLVVIFFYYMISYEHPHKYNNGLTFYRHNLILQYSCDVFVLRFLSFFGMAWMALSYIAGAKAVPDRVPFLLLLPMAILAVVPMPLIEQRYYIVSLCLFLAMRPPVPEKVTIATLAYYVGATAYISYHVSRANFFL